jgi:chaperone BCS1
MLVNNYLRLKDHKFFSKMDDIFQSRASLSPAELRELMVANRNSPSRAIKSILTALQTDNNKRGVGKIGWQSENNTTPNNHLFKNKK